MKNQTLVSSSSIFPFFASFIRIAPIFSKTISENEFVLEVTILCKPDK